MAEQKKSRKFDRCRKSGQNLRYIRENRHGKSHVRRITAHLRRFPADIAAAKELVLYGITTGQFRLASFNAFMADVGSPYRAQ